MCRPSLIRYKIFKYDVTKVVIKFEFTMKRRAFNTKTLKAILDVINGRVIRCKDFEDFKRKMGIRPNANKKRKKRKR